MNIVRVLSSKCLALVGNPDEAVEVLHWSTCTLLYCCESWTVTVITRLQAAEMWFLRRMLRIKWREKISNDDVLQRADSSRELVNYRYQTNTVPRSHSEKREIGRIDANSNWTKAIEGNEACGRQRLTFLGWLQRKTGVKPFELIAMLKDKT